MFLKNFIKKRDLDGAEKLIDEMEQNGVPKSRVTYNSLMELYISCNS